MRTFADTVVVGKRSLNMDDFRRQFDENRTLTEKEKIMISDYTEKIKADINKIS